MFVLYREGVYMQGIYGLYTDLENAIVNARKAIEKEDDDYHSFFVSKLEVDGDPFYSSNKKFEIARTDKRNGRYGKLIKPLESVYEETVY